MRNVLGRLLAKSPRLFGWAVACDNFLRGTRVRVHGENNRLIFNGARLVGVRIVISGNNNLLQIGSGCRLFDCCMSLRGDGHRLEIGRDCVLGKMYVEIQSTATAMLIGERTTCGGLTMSVDEPGRAIVVGDDCMISVGVEVRCGDSHSVIDASTGLRLNSARDIVIGNHVWLGAQTAVLKGSTIGKDSVVGFRSTVTGDIPPGSLAIGTPARVIRSGINWFR